MFLTKTDLFSCAVCTDLTAKKLSHVKPHKTDKRVLENWFLQRILNYLLDQSLSVFNLQRNVWYSAVKQRAHLKKIIPKIFTPKQSIETWLDREWNIFQLNAKKLRVSSKLIN